MIENKKIFILGMARSGYECAKMLSKYNNEILITDMKEQDSNRVKELEELGVTFVLSNEPDKIFDSSYDYLIKNPGIRKDHPCVLKAREFNVPVINEVEVAYSFFPKDVSIIGITGSNGKTTTTTLIYEILKKAGFPVFLGGNIGYPVSSLVEKVNSGDILVLEISDHQLTDMYNFKTNISVLTNLSEVHLDFHGTYEIYKNIKKKIFNNHTVNDIAILNYDNNDVMELTNDIVSTKKYFSKDTIVDCYIKDDAIYYKDKVIDLRDIKVKGMHNYENIMCAIMAVKEFNVNDDVIVSTLKEFKGVEHRIEYVTNINGREIYNDAKATNTESTITALKSFDKPTILLLGGLDRGHSFEPLNNYMNNVKQVICYGETKNRIKDWCNDININCVVVDTLEQATIKAYECSDESDIILLSPACASWDQYDSFEKRGEEFKRVVGLLNE